MGKIKHTKNELKTQREALRRFERFLPMLQLKKQQLQMEIQQTEAKITARENEERAIRNELAGWTRLFSGHEDVTVFVGLESVRLGEGNIAGVPIPLAEEIIVRRENYDLFETPLWIDDAVETLDKLIRLRVEREVLQEQKARIVEELRVTSQRVNLFEKVKIPECRENIRVIRIFLGDEQTASVARGKAAKKRTEEYTYGDEAA